jgi:hypothetical protein
METEKCIQETSNPVSRRQVLIGAASAALVATVPSALAVTKSSAKHTSIALTSESLPSDFPVRRYMAASVCLEDGRILITGGYNRPSTDESQPMALNSAMILDPHSGRSTPMASMNLPRARHAAVLLRNGLVVVIGGLSQVPTASIEVFDPQMNEWRMVDPLDQPRYDHSVAFDGANIYVLGGSSHTMISSVEVIRVGASSSPLPA